MEQKKKLIIYDMREDTIKKVILQIASTPY